MDVLFNLFIFLIFFYLLRLLLLGVLRNFFVLFARVVGWGFLRVCWGAGEASLLFFFVLLVVVLRVFLFCSFYLGGELKFTYFFFVFLVFILRMVLLNFRKSLLFLLVSWDILGISSYFLVLFYNNWDRNVGAMNVVLTNRLGDFLLFFLFSFVFCSSLFLKRLSGFFWFVFRVLLFAGFTKRAQFPFRRWLPKAMSAPTPVRALVHRRTLVTAGLILIINFSVLIYQASLGLFLVLGGVFTMFFSRASALAEQDIKKVVALRTLSQIGFSSFVLGLRLNFFCLFHLLRHALFKRCLFVQVGALIYYSLGQQDGRFYSFLWFSPLYLQFQALLTLFCLCGMFFSRGLVRKDFVLEFFFFLGTSVWLLFLFYVSVFFTFFYCSRLWFCFVHTSLKVLLFSGSKGVYYYLSFFLVCFSVFFVWFLNKNLLFSPVFSLYLRVYSPLFFVFCYFLLVYFLLKLFLYFLRWRFLVDYFSKFFSYFLWGFRFFDLFLNSFLGGLWSSIKVSGSRFVLYFINLNLAVFVSFFFLIVFLF